MSIVSRGVTKGGGSSGGKLGLSWGRLNASFWFLPALLTAGAVPLFFLAHFLDRLMPASLTALPLVFSGDATAARAVVAAVAAVAGSLITVIATVFSLTVVTLQLASASYTPRIMRSFTSDRGVQAVLEVYIATFLYSLLVLRVIRAPEGEGAAFNPVVSVTAAVVLALACVGLLIYFIGHIVNIIQSSTIVGNAHAYTMEALARLDDLGDAPAGDPENPAGRPELAGLLAGEPFTVRARESGYVQFVGVAKLLRAATGGGGDGEGTTTVVEVPFAPGTFVAAGLTLVRVWPARGPGPGGGDGLRDAFVLDRERSFQQDFAFGLRQLSDIALKGLSPGVNDPTTAMQAMDRIEAVFVALGEKAMPPRVREERVREEEADGGQVLVKVGYYGFDDVAGLAFDQIRRAAFTSGQVAVLERLLEILSRAIAANVFPERRRALWAHVFAVARLAPEQVPDPGDAANLAVEAVGIGTGLLETDLRAEVEPDLEELAGASEGIRGGERVREALEHSRKTRRH